MTVRKPHKFMVLGAIVVAFLLVSVLALSSNPTNKLPEQTSRKIVVVATTFPIYDFTRRVAGDAVELYILIQPGREFHDFEPNPGIIELVRKAHILVYNGAGLEPWLDRLVDASGNKALILVNTSDGLELIKAEDRGEGVNRKKGQARLDPHVWLDPLNAKQQVAKITNALVKADPFNMNFYQRRTESYMILLDEIHEEISNDLGRYIRKDFVAFHSSFGYFARRYGLTQHSVVGGGDPHQEPGAKEMAMVIELAKSMGIKVIYAEPLFDPRLAQVVAEQIGGRVLVLDPLDGISEQEFKASATYLSKMRENLRNLIEGLKGE